MSVEPPSSGRPTGPPSGPLSGPSQPPSGPPSTPPSAPPPGGSSGGSSGGATGGGPPVGPPEPGPKRPWWRSAPRVALLATAVVAAIALVLLLTLPGGDDSSPTAAASPGSGKIFTQAAAKSGPDPFTDSTTTDDTASPLATTPSRQPGATEPNTVTPVNGATAGLYGGTLDVSSCDVEKQITYLRASPTRNRAFASVAGVQPDAVPGYLRSLTPVQLRFDTWVTNHGYRDGTATSYQAVLQAGTAVLVDTHGEPRVRCACGNPLTRPVPQPTTLQHTGDTWPSYHPDDVVKVVPARTAVKGFVLYDPDSAQHWFVRKPGDTRGDQDKPTRAPGRPKPSESPSTTPPSPSSPSSSPAGPSSPDSPSPESPSAPADSGPTTGPPAVSSDVTSGAPVTSGPPVSSPTV